MLFHAKALELYTAAFQNVFSMDEEQDIEVCNFSANLALASNWPTSSCVAQDKKSRVLTSRGLAGKLYFLPYKRKRIQQLLLQVQRSSPILVIKELTSNKRRGAYLIFRATSAGLIRGRCLFKHCTRQIYFFFIFIRRYTFYLLIFL